MSEFDRMGERIVAVRPGLANIVAARSAFVRAYCAERGWDPDNITLEQLLEIRAQKEWKAPDGSRA